MCRINNKNPPYFPFTRQEVAKEVAFSIKLGLIRQLTRLRVDVNMRITENPMSMIECMLFTCFYLFDSNIQTIYVYVIDEYEVNKFTKILTGLVHNNSQTQFNFQSKCIYIKHIKDHFHINSINQSISIIYRPDNIYNNYYNSSVLEDIQSLCFQMALNKVPTIIINPTMISTACNDYSARIPLLLNDFQSVYSINDQYIMLNNRDIWYGIINRLEIGSELYILNHINQQNNKAGSYLRVESRKNDCLQDLLCKYSNFLYNCQNEINKSLSPNDSNLSMTSNIQYQPLNNFDSEKNFINLLEKNFFIKPKFSWKNTIPPN